MPETWQSEFGLEHVCGHGLDPWSSFCTDRFSQYPLQPPCEQREDEWGEQ